MGDLCGSHRLRITSDLRGRKKLQIVITGKPVEKLKRRRMSTAIEETLITARELELKLVQLDPSEIMGPFRDLRDLDLPSDLMP